MGQFPRLPVLRGVGAGQRFPELVRVLEVVPIIGAEVVAAELVGKRRWDITMSGGLIVRLPEEEMETAWSSFADHMERSYLPLEGLAGADYSLRDRLVLQFDEVVVKQSGESLVSLRPLGGGSKESYTPGSYNFGSLGPG